MHYVYWEYEYITFLRSNIDISMLWGLIILSLFRSVQGHEKSMANVQEKGQFDISNRTKGSRKQKFLHLADH